jgi:hypothetical protein
VSRTAVVSDAWDWKLGAPITQRLKRSLSSGSSWSPKCCNLMLDSHFCLNYGPTMDRDRLQTQASITG